MRVFVAGATGVIGHPLTRLLVEAGHVLAGMTRSESNRGRLEAIGALPVVCDVYDLEALRAAVVAFAPDAVVHELTDLPDDAAQIAALGARNDRIRSEGTRNLLAAAQAAGAHRFVAQSIAWTLPAERAQTIAAHEQAVLDVGGVVARYGQFYGPGTYHPDDRPDPPRVHVDEAARRTVPLLHAPSGIVEIVEPAV